MVVRYSYGHRSNAPLNKKALLGLFMPFGRLRLHSKNHLRVAIHYTPSGFESHRTSSLLRKDLERC